MEKNHKVNVDGKEVQVVLKGQGVTTSVHNMNGLRLGSFSKGYKRGQWFSHHHDGVTVTLKTKKAAIQDVIEAALYSGHWDTRPVNTTW